MATSKIKKGDLVKIIAGTDKGKKGKVISLNRKDKTVLVEGINMITKHAKPNAQNQNGGIINQEASIDISNVMYVIKDQVTRIGFTEKDGKKVRVAKATGEIID